MQLCTERSTVRCLSLEQLTAYASMIFTNDPGFRIHSQNISAVPKLLELQQLPAYVLVPLFLVRVRHVGFRTTGRGQLTNTFYHTADQLPLSL